MADLTKWWDELRPATREHLSADPHGPVPADLWPDVIRHGVGVAGAYFPSTADRPDGYRLPSETARFIEKQSEHN